MIRESVVTDAERLAIYLEVAAKLRATGERGSEVAALLVEQLADELVAPASRKPAGGLLDLDNVPW